MPKKSHVGLGALICPVCGKTEEDGTILLDMRLRESLEHVNVTGYGLCKEHRAQCEQGFVHLVEIDQSKSSFPLSPSTAYRTGNLAALKREAAAQIINVPIEAKFDFVYIEPGVIEKLQSMVEKDDGGQTLDSRDAGTATTGPTG